MSFASLALSDFLLSSLERLGYEKPTPIQEASIPVILSGRDLQGAAQTGSGKTAAFCLPMVQCLSESEEQPRKPRHLILVPTRELAVQVGKALERYSEGAPKRVRVMVAYGGVGYQKQMTAAAEGIDVVVATPGRLIDLAEQRAVELDELELLVLDEADRLLALGFADELNAILDMLPERRQNLLFSATFPQNVISLANALLNDPEKIELEAAARPVEKVVQRAIEVEANKRTGLLRHLLDSEGWERVLVFVGSKRRAENVTAKLQKYGIKAVALHGDMPQEKRARSLERFRANRVRVLMATDVAARGIDIAGLPCVVNYDLPRGAADYVHRIGRTGRAGEEGVAINFVSDDVDAHMKLLEKRNGLNLERERVEGFEPENWDPKNPSKGKAPVKGKRPSKKDKLRRAAAEKKESPWGNAKSDVSDPWGQAKRKEGRG
ncbi:DEAD/DEAH box helicase [Pelagicoccus mobilis]|uniref:DEAD/DEAH box helicase n=1 Tax=Pelagicoccus mobilis TaxID=415221 RepID=A0A934S598_9BACT|nr:DEAD/DEAH box helicase [Pelagicoccus mobilis]MBK1879213.1 DEAD/DEAH box helicase [Pelagicoccus mobilis]